MGPLTASFLLESSDDWMWAVDTAGRHVYTNRAITTILGYSTEEMLALPAFTTLVHPDDRPRMKSLLERSVANQSGWNGETFRWLRKDGTWRWLESQGTPLFDEEGKLSGFCGADRDLTLRIEQERRIAESERRFRATFEQAAVGIAHVGLDGRWLRVNQPLCDMLGYSTEELMQLTFADITHPDDLDADLAEARRLFAGEIRSYQMDKRYIRKDGSLVWASLTGSVVRDAAGAVEYAIAVVRDITERKVREAAHRQSEKDYRTLFESSHDVILLVDPENGTIIAANRRAAERYGCSPDELTGRSMQTLACEATEPRRRLQELLEGACEVEFTTTHRRSDGSLVDLHARVVLVQYGGRDAFLATYRDVTAENRLMRIVAESERRFRSIVEHGYGILAIVDGEARVRFASGAVERTLGHAADALMGSCFFDFVHPEDREQLVEVFAALAAQPDFRPNVVCRIAHQNGEWRWCEGSGVNMLAVDGVEGIVIVARDITERMELEARLEQTRRVESLGRVAATVAHEFNNVLMTIQPVADILTHRYASTPQLARFGAQLAAGVNRGRVMVGAILGFANPKTPVRHEIRLQQWLAELAHELHTPLGPRVELTIDAPEPLALDADPDQLHQLVMNLVLNARDAMPNGGAIRVAASSVAAGAGGQRVVELAVHDTGSGISPELQSQIFEPLFTTKAKGTGLGLSLCQQIAAAHGATIAVETGEQGGAVFRVRFPSRPRLLLVEDDPTIAEALQVALEDFYDLEWASAGAGVVEHVRTARPDLVLLDIQLPDANGLDLFAAIRTHSPELPVVLMSGSVPVTAAELDRRAAFLPKPFATGELLRVASALARAA